MKSVRLTKFDKECLVDDLVKGLFDKKEAALQESVNAFGQNVYTKFVAPYLPAMKSLPEEACCNENGFRMMLNTSYRSLYPKFKEEKKFLRGYDLIPNFDAKKHKQEHKTFEKLFQQTQKLQEEKSNTRAKTEGAVFSVNMSKQLQERWPEAFEVWKKSNPVKSDSLLPTIPRDEMNKLLGLKTVAAAVI